MSKYLEVGLEAVKAAEKVILQYFNDGNFDEQRKSDDSPVTKADKEAQKIISHTILNNFPDHFILGEEDVEDQDLEGKEFVWIIDPIDGTKSYIRHRPLFSSLLALMHNGEFIVGISNAPLMHELLYASKGDGAFLNDKKIQASKVDSISRASIAFGGLKYFKKHNNLDSLADLCAQAEWARGTGDFWSYHMVAQGSMDAMVETQTKIWDIAPHAVIVEEAGGKITDLQGNPLTLESTSALATNGFLHDDIKSYFTEVL